MKTNAIIRIIAFSIAIILMTGVLTAFVAEEKYMADFDSFETSIVHWNDPTLATGSSDRENSTLDTSASFDASQIRQLHIEWAVGSITVQPGDTDTIEIRESGSGKPFVIRQNGDKLIVKFDDVEAYFGITIDHSKDLYITVPADWICRDLEMDVASADVKISNLTVNSIDFDGASGTCTFTNCSVGQLDIDTASGNIHFTGCLDYLDCDAASADCVLVLSNVPKSIDMDGASGDLDITLPEGSGFSLTLDGLSSDFRTDFDFRISNDCYVSGDGSCRIEVDAMSGNVCIRKGAAVSSHVHDETCDDPGSNCTDGHHH